LIGGVFLISPLKDNPLIQTLQTLQLILFAIPLLTLLAIGTVILIKPVSAINRRWMLLVFLPMLLANLLAILENDSLSNDVVLSDWRLWLILVTDVALAVGIIFTFHGFIVYGLSATETEDTLVNILRAEGYEVEQRMGEKRVLWGRIRNAFILMVQNGDQSEDVWITSRGDEVLIRMDSPSGLHLLKKTLSAIQSTKTTYDFRAHAMGVLYIVLAVVFAGLSWIFFFEPRLILIE